LDTPDTTFRASREHFEALVEFLGADACAGLTHARLEEHLASAGRELTRLLLQDHLDLRATREQRLDEAAIVSRAPLAPLRWLTHLPASVVVRAA